MKNQNSKRFQKRRTKTLIFLKIMVEAKHQFLKRNGDIHNLLIFSRSLFVFPSCLIISRTHKFFQLFLPHFSSISLSLYLPLPLMLSFFLSLSSSLHPSCTMFRIPAHHHTERTTHSPSRPSHHHQKPSPSHDLSKRGLASCVIVKLSRTLLSSQPPSQRAETRARLFHSNIQSLNRSPFSPNHQLILLLECNKHYNDIDNTRLSPLSSSSSACFNS